MKIEIERQYINEELARRAKEAYSFSDYVQGSATATYESYLTKFENAINEMLENKEVSNEDFEKVQHYANRYGIRLANAINDDNSCTASCPSIMICGLANFPTRKKEKQNSRAHDLWERDKGLYNFDYNNYYYEKIRKILTNNDNIIYSDDKNAVEKLEKKIAQLKENHENMKKANIYFKENNTIEGCPFLTEKEIKDIQFWMSKGFSGRPFNSYSLSSNLANIRRLEDRLASLKKTAERIDTAPAKEENGNYKIVRNQEEMRFQLIFNDIPSAETREILKSNGFRWSPKNQAWQRLLNENSERAYNRIKSSL